MMTIKLNDIVNGFETLNNLCSEKLPIKISYKLLRLIKMITPEFELFNQERIKLIYQYGEAVDDASGEYKIINIEEFTSAMNDLGNQDIELNFDIIDMSSIEKLNLSVQDIVATEAFIKYDTESEVLFEYDDSNNGIIVE